ncbi:MAG: hypothetical protein NBV65_06630 [Burkholderiaceae bacterium]|nr:hypothetical protein [Burkholderiaceae bacterium]
MPQKVGDKKSSSTNAEVMIWGPALDKVEQVIIEGRRLVAKVDAILRRAEEFNRQYGFEPGELEKYMQKRLSPAERAAVERQVQRAVRELQEETERALHTTQTPNRPQRRFRPKTII